MLLVVLSPIRALALNVSDSLTSPEALLSLLQDLVDLFSSSLQQVEISQSTTYKFNGSLTPYNLNDLTSFASKHRFSLTVGPLHDPFYQTPDGKVASSLPDACAAAYETLRFGLAHSARLFEDFEGARALLDLLVPLKGEMLRVKD